MLGGVLCVLLCFFFAIGGGVNTFDCCVGDGVAIEVGVRLFGVIFILYFEIINLFHLRNFVILTNQTGQINHRAFKEMSIFDEKCFKFNCGQEDNGSVVTDNILQHIKFGLKAIEEKPPLILSLSGGVDSMVLLDAFCKLGIEFYCLHIDYGNRLETEKEAKYLESYCASRSVPLTCYTMTIQRGDDARSRSEYERITREQRFEAYKRLCDKVNTNVVCLGHHDDDVIENILCNIFNTQSLSDLGKMHLKSTVDGEHGLQMVRLLIGKMKHDIYKYAEENSIFYFKDSTPKWSKRGQIRDNILPQLENVFPRAREQLLRFNDNNTSNSRLLQLMLAKYTNFNLTVEDKDTKILGIPGDLSQECSLLNEIGLWRYIFAQATKRLGCEAISQKSLHNFMQNIGKLRVTLSRNIHIENDGGKFTIVSSNLPSSGKD